MNQYERGKHMPDFNTVLRVGEVLEVPAAYFYCEDDELAEIIAGYQNLSSAKRRKIRKLVETN